jgi:hypothetical protein
LPSNVATAAGGTTYTFCRIASDSCSAAQPVKSIRFAFVAGTSYSALDFGQVPDNQYVASAAQQAPAGLAVSYPQTFTPGTGGTVTFTPVITSTTPVVTGWNEVLYQDTACNGVINSTDPVITSSTVITATAGQPICLILNEFTPPGAADGDMRVVTVNSNFTYTNATSTLPATMLAVVDTTTTGAGDGLKLRKEVCNSTVQAAAGTPCDPTLTGPTSGRGFALSNNGSPGDVLLYRLIYSNETAKPLSALVINDATPPYTVSGAAATCPTPPTGLTACTIIQPTVGQSGSYRWTFGGTLNGAASGYVLMSVTVQ